MPRLHDQLRICGKDWHLIRKKDLTETQGVHGLTEDWEQRILYSDEAPASHVVDTLLHEIKHAQSSTMGLALSEAKVHALAALDYQLFADNPWFVELLHEHFVKRPRRQGAAGPNQG